MSKDLIVKEEDGYRMEALVIDPYAANDMGHNSVFMQEATRRVEQREAADARYHEILGSLENLLPRPYKYADAVALYIQGRKGDLANALYQKLAPIATPNEKVGEPLSGVLSSIVYRNFLWPQLRNLVKFDDAAGKKFSLEREKGTELGMFFSQNLGVFFDNVHSNIFNSNSEIVDGSRRLSMVDCPTLPHLLEVLNWKVPRVASVANILDSTKKLLKTKSGKSTGVLDFLFSDAGNHIATSLPECSAEGVELTPQSLSQFLDKMVVKIYQPRLALLDRVDGPGKHLDPDVTYSAATTFSVLCPEIERDEAVMEWVRARIVQQGILLRQQRRPKKEMNDYDSLVNFIGDTQIIGGVHDYDAVSKIATPEIMVISTFLMSILGVVTKESNVSYSTILIAACVILEIYLLLSRAKKRSTLISGINQWDVPPEVDKLILLIRDIAYFSGKINGIFASATPAAESQRTRWQEALRMLTETARGKIPEIQTAIRRERLSTTSPVAIEENKQTRQLVAREEEVDAKFDR